MARLPIVVNIDTVNGEHGKVHKILRSTYNTNEFIDKLVSLAFIATTVTQKGEEHLRWVEHQADIDATLEGILLQEGNLATGRF